MNKPLPMGGSHRNSLAERTVGPCPDYADSVPQPGLLPTPAAVPTPHKPALSITPLE
jgi:hypothetical protein